MDFSAAMDQFQPHIPLDTANGKYKFLWDSNPGLTSQNTSSSSYPINHYMIQEEKQSLLQMVTETIQMAHKVSKLETMQQENLLTLIFPSCPPDASISESREKHRQRTASSIII